MYITSNWWVQCAFFTFAYVFGFFKYGFVRELLSIFINSNMFGLHFYLTFFAIGAGASAQFFNTDLCSSKRFAFANASYIYEFGAFRMGCLSVCRRFLVRARTLERKVIETWL